MQPRFTLHEVGKLFEYAIQHRRIDVAGLCLKAAKIANADSATLLSKVIDDSALYQMALASGLTQFARYDQLDLIIELLRSNSEKVQLSAILTLQMMKDPRALEHLLTLSRESPLPTVRERAEIAHRLIAKDPVALRDNTFHAYIPLTPFEEEDMALADFILNRDLSDKEASYLAKQLFHPIDVMRKRAGDALLRQGKKNTDVVLDVVTSLNLPFTVELIHILGYYKDPRGAHLVIEWLKRKNDYINSDIFEVLRNIGGEEVALFFAERIVNGRYYDGELDALKSMNEIPDVYLLAEYKNNDHFRRTGARVLATILGGNALPVLLEGIQDRYREVRINAEMGLAKLGKSAVVPLITLLNSSNNEAIKLHVCGALGKIGDNRALEPLYALTHGVNRALRLGALSAIGQISDPSSIRILSEWIAVPDRHIRLVAVKGLGNQHYMEAVERLLNCVNDKDHGVLLAVVDALYELAKVAKNAQRRITTAFLQLLTDEDKAVAASAESYLIDLGCYYKNVQEEIDGTKRTIDNELRIEHLSKKIQKEISRRKSILDEQFMACLEADMPPPPATEIPEPITDSIQLSVSAPQVVCPGRSFILDVWAYFDSASNEIKKLARNAQRDEAIMLRSKNAVQVQRDTTLSVRLNIPDFKIKEKDTIYWGGTTGNCTFPVKVPHQIDVGFYLGTASFHVGPLQIAKLNFEIEVGLQEKKEADVTTREHRIKTAFASYASDDRDKVLGRIQGMLKLLPELDIFLDVASLRSGEDWASRLQREIEDRDIFYLFWSCAASKSPWVEKEWRIALITKGISCIDPVPLEPPSKAPPPPELSSLHFNEWTLAFEK